MKKVIQFVKVIFKKINTEIDCSYRCYNCLINFSNCDICSSNRINPPICDCPIGKFDDAIN